MVEKLCIGTLQSLGINVINLGLSTTPTVEIAVPKENAHGGIILTASHNPKQWNALKLLNEKGEFISAKDGEHLLTLIKNKKFQFSEVDELGIVQNKDHYIKEHIEDILQLEMVDTAAIKAANISVVVDAVNSTGGIVIPQLLHALGCEKVTNIFCEPNGDFLTTQNLFLNI